MSDRDESSVDAATPYQPPRSNSHALDHADAKSMRRPELAVVCVVLLGFLVAFAVGYFVAYPRNTSQPQTSNPPPIQTSPNEIFDSAFVWEPPPEIRPARTTSFSSHVQNFGGHGRGGVHVLMDVEFITDAHKGIDDNERHITGNSSSDSPYGLWGNLGTDQESK